MSTPPQPPCGDPTDPREPIDAVHAQVVEARALARPLLRVIALLAEGPQSLDDLVRIPAVPRRTVEELLNAAGSDVVAEHSTYQLAPAVRDHYRERFAIDETASTPDGAIELLRGLIATGPPPESALDHVTATPETALRRAEWLRDNYDLRGARLLCLGDHDLTSLAVCLVEPSASVTVVDVDERILAHIDSTAAANGLTVRTLHADLRFGLPQPVAGSADLVFTDPPYTPEGIGLFATRAAECLYDSHSRVLIAYGFSERSPALGHKVQQELLRLGMVFEAIVPGFHRYHGAQAIGSASDLYVCQPTAHTRKLALRQSNGIYTHGPHSVESTASTLSAGFLQRLTEISGVTLETLRGPGWSRPITGHPGVFDLRADPGSWLLRMLLATNTEHAAFLVSNNHPDITNEQAQRALSDILTDKYSLRFHRSSPDSKHAVVLAQATGSTSARHYLLQRAHGKLGNTAREALISAAGDSGSAMTKRQANDSVAALTPEPSDLDLRLIDLPRHRLTAMLSAMG